ncbi:hypothetical protein COE15_25360 [Bacillus cereus]|uniref:3-oxoacyl-[acyl-carrier-protein] synthase III C-terminal domain-containing protein n=1 Tax=Bacillus TaxID=1386 RepID=UPI000BF3A0B1|nr:3-oxoacyl-[acyl-carrier-protein] synthase III C-terminal domain-containing protein [Bacillus sp. AFS023182]PFE01018.1 hypothetical protein CN288_18035 [Bacillus sp. AFS023182]PGX91137.1 hypothetical protein COE15_25360 [Bacillus cereus]
MNEKIGISGIGIALPDRLVSTWDVLAPAAKMRESLKETLGCNYVPIANKEESPMYFSLKAVKEALNESNTKPEEVDFIIANNLSSDYDNWQSSAYIAEQFSCTNAITVDVYGGCNTTGMAYHMAVEAIKADQQINTVLIALTEHLGGRTFPQFIGDGACALIVQRGSSDLISLNYLNLNEKMPILGVMPEGGVVVPFSSETRFDGGWEDRVEFNFDKYRKELKPIFADISTRPILELCAKSNIKVEDLDMLFVVHQQMEYHLSLLKALGLPTSKAPLQYIENLGHISGFDVFIVLKWAIRDKLVKKGDLLGFMVMGLGEWHAFLLKY